MNDIEKTAQIKLLENTVSRQETANRQVRAALYAEETKARVWRALAVAMLIVEAVLAVFR